MPPPPEPHGLAVVTSSPPAPACTQLPTVRLVANTFGVEIEVVAVNKLVTTELAAMLPVVFTVGTT